MTPQEIKLFLDCVLPWLVFLIAFILAIFMCVKYASLPSSRARFQERRLARRRISVRPGARQKTIKRRIERARNVKYLLHRYQRMLEDAKKESGYPPVSMEYLQKRIDYYSKRK